MEQTRVLVTGGRAAYEIRDFLTRAMVPFEYRDDEGPPGVAVCTFDDGECLVRPTLPEVARRLGLLADPRRDHYDLGIVGAGPAGLAAAVYAASEGLATVLVDEFAPGGQAGTSSRIENYLGFPDGISGAELAMRARRQAEKFGAEILMLRSIVEGGPDGDGQFAARLSDGKVLRATSALVATGVDWRRLDVPGVERLLHAGVYYGAASSEAPGVRGKDVFIVGGGNSAGQAAMNFAGWAGSVTMIVRDQDLSATMSDYLSRRIDQAPNIAVRACTEVARFDGDDWLRTVTLRDRRTGQLSTEPGHAVFICIGGMPQTQWSEEGRILVDSGGYLVTGRDLFDPVLCGDRRVWPLERDPYPLETSQPGLFAAGDVRHGSTKRVSAAVGEGAMAVPLIHRYLHKR